MTAAELRALVDRLNTLAEGYGPFTIADQLRTAAEVMDLLAWQSERRAGVGPGWTDAGWVCEVDGEQYEGDTPISTLRRAREVKP